MSDFVPPMLRWDDARYPLVISECNRYLIDGENPTAPYLTLIHIPSVKCLGHFQQIDDAKAEAYRHLVRRVRQDAKSEMRFYGLSR